MLRREVEEAELVVMVVPALTAVDSLVIGVWL